LDPTYLAADIELMRRFHNIPIDDLQLRDTSISEIRKYLTAWFASTTPKSRNGPRFTTIILLDSQVVENLNRLPEKPTREESSALWRTRSHEWAKFVDVSEDEGQKCRVWICDLANLFALLIYGDHGVADAGMEEASDGLGWQFYQAC
jgi:hypothetical protein